ncbi:MAG: hypothetical protein HZC40_13545, partial [Chloroflexi bacterium]|nr:hypothetical protein [Chloroflexota bacterium]
MSIEVTTRFGEIRPPKSQHKSHNQIVEAEGNYVWTVKDNQATLRQDIELLFQPEQTVKGFSAGTQDFRTD